jgi:adenosylcobinamide kinase/adenosylcobinamide-phosphate guanylyltransferase
MTYLVTGGSKMGKSTWAEDLALELAKDGPVHYIATFKPVDAEDALVIARHKKARAGRNFAVTEKHQGLEAVVIPPGAVVMLEDLPNLLANEVFDDGDVSSILPGLKSLKALAEHFIIVTNEVGSDGTVYDALTGNYVEALSFLNRQAACLSDVVVEVVCGFPQMIKGDGP